jgi:hypothetical protein
MIRQIKNNGKNITSTFLFRNNKPKRAIKMAMTKYWLPKLVNPIANWNAQIKINDTEAVKIEIPKIE